jgi:hypothetical protein
MDDVLEVLGVGRVKYQEVTVTLAILSGAMTAML